jgi:hypothetical protein
MKMNLRQEELVEELVAAIKGKYPEVNLVEVKESPETPDTLWICITAPKDEDREIELRSFSADKATDILCDYGYHMLVMPIY